MRDTVRLDEERRAAKSPVIHCYGHGGQRIVLHWCCRQTNGEVYEDNTLQSNI